MTALVVEPQVAAIKPKAGQSHWARLPMKAKIGSGVLGVFVVLAVIGPWIAPDDPSLLGPLSLASPSSAHWFGTTTSGQDVLSQVLVGIRATIVIGVVVGVLATILSVLFGVAAGYLGGWPDEGLSLATNVMLVIPALPLLVVLLGYVKQQGQWPTIAVLTLLGWPFGARVLRAQTLSIRNRDYVTAAREVGERHWRIMIFEVVPNLMSLIAANFVGVTLYAIGTSVALAFLGLANLDTWSLGTVLYWAQSQNALQAGAWWWVVPPGLVVALIGTGLVLLNFGLDEYINPRLRAARTAGGRGGKPARLTDPTPVVLEQPVDERSTAQQGHAVVAAPADQ